MEWNKGTKINECNVYYKKFILSKYILSINVKDNVVLTSHGENFVIKNFSYKNSLIVAIGNYILTTLPVYNYPHSSLIVGICKFMKSDLDENIKSIIIDEDIKRCVRITLGEHDYIFPLLH